MCERGTSGENTQREREAVVHLLGEDKVRERESVRERERERESANDVFEEIK